MKTLLLITVSAAALMAQNTVVNQKSSTVNSPNVANVNGPVTIVNGVPAQGSNGASEKDVKSVPDQTADKPTIPKLPEAEVTHFLALLVESQNEHRIINESDLGKSVAAIDSVLQEIQQKFISICGPDNQLGSVNLKDPKSDDYHRPACVAKPPEQVPQPAKTKEK